MDKQEIMWNIEDKNVKFKGGMTGYGFASTDFPSAEKRNFPPSTGRPDKVFLAEPSGKGEFDFRTGNKISNDAPSLYWGNSGDNLHTMSDGMISQHKLQTANSQQGLHMFRGKNVQFAKPNVVLSQYGRYQFSDPNSFSTSLQTKGVNFQKSGLNNLETMFHCTEPSQSNTLVGEYSQPSNSQHLNYGLSSQAEAGKFLSHVSEGAMSIEKYQAGFNPNDVMNLGASHFLPSNDTSFDSINACHRMDTSSVFSQSGIRKTELGGHLANFDGRNFSGDVCYVGTSTEAVRDGYIMEMAGTPSVSLNMTDLAQTSAATVRNQAHESRQYPRIEVQTSCYLRGNADTFYAKDQEKNESGMPEKPSDNKRALSDSTRLNRSSNEAHASRKADGSSIGIGNDSLKEEISQEMAIVVNKPAAPCETRPSLSMGSTSKLTSVKVAPTVVAKLWDGTLQLNTSTVVSAVAVFKSGEKVSEINWSKNVEVKGKVRLEAFEKFVQELPRSRTRALMVISIHWKAGSSEAGLMGMKEVAKGYKEGQRVGFAQLCPGIDLYVCPRSDAIITILAKYGFFKGMAAVEEDQDSLIGCVVWRRNHPSSDLALKKSEKNEFSLLEQPLGSPESAISNNADQNSSITKTMDSGSNQVIPGFKMPSGASSPLKNENTDEIKNIKSTNVLTNIISNSKNASPMLAPSPTHIPSVIRQLPTSVQKMDIPPEDSRKLSHASVFGHDAVQRNPQVGFEPSLQVLSGAPQTLEDNHRSSAENDDDDLPEFDFGNAYGVPQLPDSRLPLSSRNHHPSEVLPPHNQQDAVDFNRNTSVPIPPGFPSVRPLPPNNAHRPHLPSSFGLMQDVNQNVPPAKEVGVHARGSLSSIQTMEPSSSLGGSEIVMNSAGPAALSSFEQKMVETVGPSGKSGVSEVQSSASQATKSSLVQRRPIWDDDDDDMPEWCPPNLDHEQLPPMPVLPPLPLPTPPPLRPMLPTASRPPFWESSSSSTASWSSMPPPALPRFQLQQDQNMSHRHQSGIPSHHPYGSNPKIPTQTRPATRFDLSDWRASPEPIPNQAKRQRRVSGWDVKPWEVKPDLQHGQSNRY